MRIYSFLSVHNVPASLQCLWKQAGQCLVLMLGLLLAASCSSRPEGVMRAGKMEDVLYDYHLARAIALSEGKPEAERDRRYEEAVFAKYGITAEEFYASVRYYEAHPKELAKIYANLNERFGGTAATPAQQTANAPDARQGSDIWPASRFFVLSSREVNRYDFDFAAPQDFNKGDRLEWTFDLQWIYPEGRKNGNALLVLHFENDSTATFSQPLYGTGRQTLIAPIGAVKPQRISGFIYQDCAWNAKACLLVVSNLAMKHIRKSSSQPAGFNASQPDSQAVAPHRNFKLDTTGSALDTMPIRVPDQGPRLSRQEGERRILDSIRRHARGRQPMFK